MVTYFKTNLFHIDTTKVSIGTQKYINYSYLILPVTYCRAAFPLKLVTIVARDCDRNHCSTEMDPLVVLVTNLPASRNVTNIK